MNPRGPFPVNEAEMAIPCTLMRGGTSKGPFFDARDLPGDPSVRDRVLLALMGSPDRRQIDGIGGADPLTSKVGIVSVSEKDGVDLEFLFAQVSIDKPLVDTTPNCGNMLAAVVPFAIDKGLLEIQGELTTARVLTLNTGMLSDISVRTPGGQLELAGDCHIDGVPGTHSPIAIDFLDIAGSVCDSMLPTGNVRDIVDGVAVTCIDNGMPVVVLSAETLGRSGYETRDELNGDVDLKARLERIRLEAGVLMGLGDVTEKVVPKMTLVAPARNGGSISTRTFIPKECHASIGVLGAVSVATACMLRGSVPFEIATIEADAGGRLSIEHPSGEFTVDLEIVDGADGPQVNRAALLRTARKLFAGHVFIPSTVWQGQ
jgi:4-oxalomesaconate tautomerase